MASVKVAVRVRPLNQRFAPVTCSFVERKL